MRGPRRACDVCRKQHALPAPAPAAPAVPVVGAAVWVEDTAHSSCMLCGGSFTLVERRHHCRQCGKLVCWSCSENNYLLSNLEDDDQRVCDPCFENLRDAEYAATRADECVAPILWGCD